MRGRKSNSHKTSFLALAVWALALLPWAARAGGPMLVGGAYGLPGIPFTWDPAVPVPYRVDGGAFALKPDGTVSVSGATGLARVQSMFKVWEDVPTASISFTYAGPIRSTAGFSDGNVSTVEEFDAVGADCNAGAQSPFIFDADGSIFLELTGEPGIIGFSGPCKLDPSTGRILSGFGMFSGRFQDGVDTPDSFPANYELTSAEMDEVLAHEFGHFLGLDHSTVNVISPAFFGRCPVDDLAGMALMYPYAVCQAKSTLGFPMLAPDDLAWITRLYPETADAPPAKVPYTAVYGTIRGTILFSDGQTHIQGLDVVARDTVQPRRIAVSVFSGYLFSPYLGAEPGTGSYYGSTDPLLVGEYDFLVPAGNYHVWVGSFPDLLEGATFSTINPHIPNPGAGEYWDSTESATDSPLAKTPVNITAGSERNDIHIILNGTPPRFDSFESASLAWPDPPPVWRREDDLSPREAAA